MKISNRFAELLKFIVCFFFTYGVWITGQMLMDGEFKRQHLITMIGAFVANLLTTIVLKRIRNKEESKRAQTSS